MTTQQVVLRDGLTALPPEQLLEIGHGIAALAEQTARPITCPMLDPSQGACTVYAHRPVAGRTYGFYVQHDKGLYCNSIFKFLNLNHPKSTRSSAL